MLNIGTRMGPLSVYAQTAKSSASERNLFQVEVEKLTIPELMPQGIELTLTIQGNASLHCPAKLEQLYE